MATLPYWNSNEVIISDNLNRMVRAILEGAPSDIKVSNLTKNDLNQIVDYLSSLHTTAKTNLNSTTSTSALDTAYTNMTNLVSNKTGFYANDDTVDLYSTGIRSSIITFLQAYDTMMSNDRLNNKNTDTTLGRCIDSEAQDRENADIAINNIISNIQANGGGRNLLCNSIGKFQPNLSKIDNWLSYTDSTVYMTQGQQYTVHATASDGLVWSGTHDNSKESNNVVLWLTDNAKVSQIISDTNTGVRTTFTWSQPSGIYHLRVNTYKSDNSGYVDKVMLEKGTIAHDWSPAPEDVNTTNLAKSDLQKILNCVTDVFQIDMQRSLNATSKYNYFNDRSFYLYNYSFSGASAEYYPYQSETGTSATLSPIPVDRGSLGHGIQISFDLVASASGGSFVPVLNGYPVSDLGLSPTPIKSGTNSYSFFVEFPADTDSSKNVGFGLKISDYTGTLKIANLEININDSFKATQSAYSTLKSKIDSAVSSMSDTDTVNLFKSGIFDDLSNYFVSRDTMNHLIETNLTSSISKTASDISETNTLISKYASSTMVLSPSKVKGANVSAFGTMDYGEIQTEANSLNLNTITVSLLVRAKSVTDSNPYCTDDDWAKMKKDCEALIARGYKVLIQPYPYIDGGKYAETVWNPDNVTTFFQTYTAIIEKMATYAQSVGAYGIYVGTNLSLIESNVSQMSTLIQDAKKIFSSGLIFYRTNWWATATWSQSTIDAYNTKLNYAFWKYVDVIAIASYFEITDELNPSSETLQRELSSTELYARKQDIVTEIKNFHTKWGKPIYFGELGIPPYSNSASKPYATQMDTTATYNEAVQANWFDAWYTVFSQFDWWLGYSIFTIADSTSPYNPYGKQASSVIRMQTFGGERMPKTSISVSEPSVPNTNDIWLVDDGNKNITAIKKWNGTSWDKYELKLS